MIPILTAAQIRDADAFTITNEPVVSIDLMERAARACADIISARYDVSTSFIIVCGQGNNGGDGLAIARMLSGQGFGVEVFILKHKEQGSHDFEINLKRLKTTNVSITESDKHIAQGYFSGEKVIIDAIFGTGLNKPAEGFASVLIHMMNTSDSEIISIDIPSGLFSEGTNTHASLKNTVQANHTLTFQAPKLSFLLPDSGQYTGDFSILDIGLHQTFIETLKTSYYFIDSMKFSFDVFLRTKFSHKGNYGHALIIAGSKGKTGAAVLSAHACLRSGAGLVTVHLPSDSVNIIQTALPEAMVSVDKHSDRITGLPDLSNYNSIAAGPGIGTNAETASMLKLLIQNAHCPLILDADALNILSHNKTWLSFLPSNSILTPHPGEFDRLFGKTGSHFERLELQTSMSSKYNCIIILKVAHTSISFPNGTVIFNSTGNPGMATAGSGDVLTGMIAGMFAQIQSPAKAAQAGVFLHGKAGDFAAAKLGQHAMISGDIISCIHEAIRQSM